MARDLDAAEAGRSAQLGEGLGLGPCPPMAGVAGRGGPDAPLGGEETTAGRQDASDLGQAGVEIRPVMHGRERPRHVA